MPKMITIGVITIMFALGLVGCGRNNAPASLPNAPNYTSSQNNGADIAGTAEEESTEPQAPVFDEEIFSEHNSQITGQRVSVSGSSNFAIDSDGTLWAWGAPAQGLGDGTWEVRSSPVRIIDNMAAVSSVPGATSEHVLAIDKNGTLWGWGNIGSYIGNYSYRRHGSPFAIRDNIIAVCAVNGRAIDTDGILVCLGTNNVLHHGSHNLVYVTRDMLLDSDGTLWHWRGPFDVVSIMDGVAAVSACARYTAAIDTNGSLWAWGREESPAYIMSSIAAVSQSIGLTMAVDNDGYLWHWEADEHGRFTGGGNLSILAPIRIMGNIATVTMGEFHTLAVDREGCIWGWGRNYGGTAKDFTTTVPYSNPVRIMSNMR